MMSAKIILASKSPRRREILESAGYDFTVVSPDADEISEGLSPRELVVENSKLKAAAVLESESGVVISADTVVVMGERILGKPRDPEDARAMLRSLSDNCHSVVTGYTVSDGRTTVSGFVETMVTMRRMYDDEIDAYVDTGSPLDKAGAYGIQEAAGMFVSKIDGDYYNVVGLPISKISEILRRDFGIRAFMK